MTDCASGIEDSSGGADLVGSLKSTRRTVEDHFPGLWPSVEAGLSTAATLLLADNANPVALIYVGAASAGKTTLVSMFDEAKALNNDLCYRSDKFSTAAFVSHSAQATEDQLKQIDLLQRIRHKVFLTPELSTIFRGRPDELADRFSIITRVMDGQGLTSDSGVHGKRGYTGDYMFAWIGATTPFDDAVWKVMAQLGSRLFFLVMDGVADPTIEDLVSAIQQPTPYRDKLEACKTAVHQYLTALFTTHKGVRGVAWNRNNDPRDVLDSIARCASLLAVLRTPIDQTGNVVPLPESPHRATAVLHNLARGHALLCGRTQLTHDDVPMIARIAASSIPGERRAVLLAFARNNGKPLTAQQVARAADVRSPHTARRIMNDLDNLKLMDFHDRGPGKTSHLKIRPDWTWSMEEPFRSIFLTSSTWQKSGGELHPSTS